MKALSIWLWIALSALVVIGAGLLFWNTTLSGNAPVIMGGTAVPPVPTLDAERVTEGKQLYAQQCASCHGAALQGVPDWKEPLADGSLLPPPHDRSGHTWHHEDSLLLKIIAQGGDPKYNSKMPAFEKTLTETQMISILAFIKSAWGRKEREFQWWMTATRDGSHAGPTNQR